MPNAPANLTATAGYGNVALQCAAVSGADWYNFYRSTTSGTGYEIVAAKVQAPTNGLPSFNDDGSTLDWPASGTTVYYVATAVEGGVESSYSPEASAVYAVSPTDYPYEFALSTALRRRIVAAALPAMNAMIAQYWIGASAAVSFNALQVTLGELYGVQGPVICVMSTADRTWQRPNDRYIQLFTTKIMLKLPVAGDGTPEQKELVETAFCGTLRDCLSSINGYTLTPRTLSANGARNMLPLGASFYDCQYLGKQKVPALYTSGDGQGALKMPCWVIMHSAKIDIPFQNRANPVGG